MSTSGDTPVAAAETSTQGVKLDFPPYFATLCLHKVGSFV